jgi:hypothetical protein
LNNNIVSMIGSLCCVAFCHDNQLTPIPPSLLGNSASSVMEARAAVMVEVLFAGDVLPGSRLGTGEIKRRGEAWREKIADLLLEAVGRDEVHSDLNSAELQVRLFSLFTPSLFTTLRLSSVLPLNRLFHNHNGACIALLVLEGLLQDGSWSASFWNPRHTTLGNWIAG